VTDKKKDVVGERDDEGAPVQSAVDAEDVVNGEAADASEQDALSRLQDELARHKEAMLRMQAETENLRKRLIRDLERLEVAPESASVESLLEGQKLTLIMLSKVMEDHHLEVIDPVGEPFDPELHEAMTVLPSPDHKENTVLEVIQKGYRLHDRLIRPAMVVVSGSA
jgi:molecular chaperone GrpE